MFKYTLKNYYVRFITHEGYTIMECGFNYNELLPMNCSRKMNTLKSSLLGFLCSFTTNHYNQINQ
jgi:hypothetical protein